VSKILITGGTGLVGNFITQDLLNKGHEVVYLSRNEGTRAGVTVYRWDIHGAYIDPRAFEGVTAVIHLAGAGIADHRWTKSYKKELYESRIRSTRLLVDFINTHHIKLDAFVSTSAMGFYGNNTLKPAVESDKHGEDFLATLCNDWEYEAIKVHNTRLVILRVGVVLAKESGFIPKVARLIRCGVGSVLGNGQQLMSWIHITDLSSLYIKALTDSGMSGIYNAVSPNPESNRTITYAMAKVLQRPILLPPVPQIALKLAFGELSSTLLANQEISSAKTEQTGFKFTYPSLQKTLDNLLSDTK
jgi:uncharacterized protein (TIGR01777 family)